VAMTKKRYGSTAWRRALERYLKDRPIALAPGRLPPLRL